MSGPVNATRPCLPILARSVTFDGSPPGALVTSVAVSASSRSASLTGGCGTRSSTSSATRSNASFLTSSVQMASSAGFPVSAVFTSRVISNVPSDSRTMRSAAPRLCSSPTVTLRPATSTSIWRSDHLRHAPHRFAVALHGEAQVGDRRLALAQPQVAGRRRARRQTRNRASPSARRRPARTCRTGTAAPARIWPA